VNAPGPLIADALREIAADAPAPRPMANAAWQAGRRRRWRGLAVAVTAGAGAIAVVIVLILAVLGSPAAPGSGPSVAALAPVTLGTPIQFRQVASISMHACPSGSSGSNGPAASQNGISKSACYRFTSKGLMVTGLESAAVVHQPGSGYLLVIRFNPGDAARFAALTRELAGQPTPRCQLAVIIGGRVISSPTVQQPITQGQAEISGFTSRAQVENLLHGS
jgi:hypothetical protein